MTLIVYKPGVLAADSRMSSRLSDARECTTCPNCNEKAEMLVTDDRDKIVLIDKNKEYRFLEDRIKAYACSGSVKVSDIVKKLIDDGEDIVETFKAFTKFNLDTAYPVSTILMVGEKFIYRFYLSGKGIRVVKSSLEKTVMTGGGKEGAGWIEHLTGGILSPMDLIVHVKAKDDSVGGPVKYVRFDEEQLKIRTLEKETDRAFDLEKIQKAVLALVPKKSIPET